MCVGERVSVVCEWGGCQCVCVDVCVGLCG